MLASEDKMFVFASPPPLLDVEEDDEDLLRGFTCRDDGVLPPAFGSEDGGEKSFSFPLLSSYEALESNSCKLSVVCRFSPAFIF